MPLVSVLGATVYWEATQQIQAQREESKRIQKLSEVQSFQDDRGLKDNSCNLNIN